MAKPGITGRSTEKPKGVLSYITATSLRCTIEGAAGRDRPPHGNEGTAPLAATAVGRDRVLQSCNAGVSKCGGARKAPVLLGQKKEDLADAIRLARNAVEGRQ